MQFITNDKIVIITKFLILFTTNLMFFNSCAHFKRTVAENDKATAEQTSYLTQTVQLLNQKWPDNRTINIVCHGHSVPAGYFKTPVVNTFNAYPHLLHKQLKKQYPYAVINVIVTAIGGENSEWGAKRFEKDVLAHNPDIITIDYGLNDRGLGLEAAKKAWISMIQKAKFCKGTKDTYG